jgi:hypothetical protein
VDQLRPARARFGEGRRSVLSGPVVWGIAALFIVVHGLVAFADPAPGTDLGAEWGTFLAISAAAIWLAMDSPNPLPEFRAVGILALFGVAEGFAVLQAPPTVHMPFVSWHIGAITLLLLVLAVRGHVTYAWLAFGGIAVATVVWAVAGGQGVDAGVSLVIRHAGTLLGGTLFAIGLRRVSNSLAALHEERAQHAFSEAAAIAALEEREAQLVRVNAMARPLLRRLALRRALNTDERAECLQVEASLRDAMRARSLFAEPVIAAARAARGRGVEVTLLDDSGDQPPAQLAQVASVVANELGSASEGRFTARLLPAGRGDVATIVVDAREQRMLMVAADGSVRTA